MTVIEDKDGAVSAQGIGLPSEGHHREADHNGALCGPLAQRTAEGADVVPPPMCWLAPGHPALAPFDPARWPHQLRKERLPPLVIRGESLSLDECRGEIRELIWKREDGSDWMVRRNARRNGFPWTLEEIAGIEDKAEPDGAIIDWLSVTFHERSYEAISLIVTDQEMIGMISIDLENIAGIRVGDEVAPKNFYTHTRRLEYADGIESRNLGFVAWGKNGNTININFTAEACGHIQLNHGWKNLEKWLHALDAKITRIDVAVDCFNGEHTIEESISLYDQKKFNNGGRNPSLRQVGNFREITEHGRTIYIGERTSGKQLRIYEKGKQLGDGDSNWVRWEVELRGRDRLVPLDVLLRPGQYFAGAYPALEWFGRVAQRIKTVIQREARISLNHLEKHCRRSYGAFLNVLRSQCETAEEVISRLLHPDENKVPKRLIFPIDRTQGEFG